MKDPRLVAGQRERLQHVIDQKGWSKGPHDRGWRRMARELGLKAENHIEQIMKRTSLTQEMAETIEKKLGYRAEWLRKGEGPMKVTDADAPVSGTLSRTPTPDEVSARWSSPARDDELREYIKHRIREMLARGLSLRHIAGELHLPIENVWMLYNGALVATEDREKVLRALGTLEVQVHAWWENEGFPARETLRHDPNLVRRAGFAAAIKKGVSEEALLAAIESREDWTTSKEWQSFAENIHGRMKREIARAQTELARRRGKAKVKDPARAPASERDKAADDDE